MDQFVNFCRLSLKMRKSIIFLFFIVMIISVINGCAGLKCGKKEATPASACEKPESSCETNNAPCTPDLPESTLSTTTTVSVSGSQEAPEGSVSVVSEGKKESSVSNVSSSSSAQTQESAKPASSESTPPAPSATSGTSTINYPSPSSEVKQGEIPDQYQGFSNSKIPQNQNNGDFINVSNEKSADSSSGKTQYNTIIEGQ